MIVDGWLSWATRIDGVSDKIYSQPNSGEGLACHSVVGREDEFSDGVPNRFLSTEKGPDGRYTAAAAASCMFILRESGELIQMYPVTASTWTSGGFDGNTRYWATEAEGGLFPNYGEKLTKAAEDSYIRLVTEWEAHTGNVAEPGVNILQHKQIAWKYGYAATACASDRYSNAWDRIASGERYGDDPLKLTETQTEDLLLRLFAGSEYEGVETREQRLERAMRELGKASTTQSLNDQTNSAIALYPHKHSPKGKGPRPL
jgi:hypothetical protein